MFAGHNYINCHILTAPLLHSYTTIHRRTDTAIPYRYRHWGFITSYRHRHRGIVPPPALGFLPAQRARTATGTGVSTGTEGSYRHRHWGFYRHRGLVPPPALGFLPAQRARTATGIGVSTGTEGSYRHRHWGCLLAPAQRALTATGTEGFYRHRHRGFVPVPAFKGTQTAYPNYNRRTNRQIPPHRHIPVPAYCYRYYVILLLVEYWNILLNIELCKI